MRSEAYVHNYGGSGKTIVLLHGFLGSSMYWSRMAPQLIDAGYRVLAIDLLGFGKSHKPETAQYDYAEHTQFIDTALRKHGVSTPFILMGHSMGAVIAKRFALAYQARVEQLILLHPPLYRTETEVKAVLRNTNTLYRFLLDSQYRDIAWSILSGARILKIANHTKRSREYSMRNVIEKAEALSDLIQLRTKTLLVIGLRDRPQYRANIKRLAVPNAICVAYEDLSHHSPLKNPKTVSSLVTDFIKS